LRKLALKAKVRSYSSWFKITLTSLLEAIFMRLILLLLFLNPLFLYAQERPGPDNTGPLVPESELLEYTGRTTITTPGTVIEGVVINGTINIKADNVTLRNFVIRSGSHYGINVRSGTGHLFEDGLIYGPTSSGVLGSDFTARRLEVTHVGGDAFKARRNFVIEKNWMHRLGYIDGAHADGIQMVGNNEGNGVIRQNFFDMRNDQPIPGENRNYANSQCIIIQTNNGSIDNVLIEGNWFDGAGYQILVNERNNYGPPTNITITDNVFGLVGLPHAQFGPLSLRNGDYDAYNNQFDVDLSSGDVEPTPTNPPESGPIRPLPTIVGVSDGQILEAGSSLPIVVTTANDDDVSSIALSLNGNLIRKERVTPYEWPSNKDKALRNLVEGNYTLSASVTTQSGETIESNVSFSVSSLSPDSSVAELTFVGVQQDQQLSEGSDVSLSVVASDDLDILSVDLFVNDRFIRTERVSPYEWPSNRSSALRDLSAGEYVVKAEATIVGSDTPVVNEVAFRVTNGNVMAPIVDLILDEDEDGDGDSNSPVNPGGPVSNTERPGPANTGPLVPESELVEYTGRTTITTPGTVLEGVIINGTVNIDADNVTLRNFVIRSGGHYGINVRSGTGHLFEDGLIYGPTSSGVLGSDFTARRLEVTHVGGDAFKARRNFVIENSWMHRLGFIDDAHADGIQMVGSNEGNGIIRNNFFDMRNDQQIPGENRNYANSQCIIIQTNNGSVDNVLITGNWFEGAGFQILLNERNDNGPPTNITITENVFGLVGLPHAQFGPLSLRNGEYDVFDNQFNVDLSD